MGYVNYQIQVHVVDDPRGYIKPRSCSSSIWYRKRISYLAMTFYYKISCQIWKHWVSNDISLWVHVGMAEKKNK